MTTVEHLPDGQIILSHFDGEQWHRESFKSTSELQIWSHANGVELEGEI